LIAENGHQVHTMMPGGADPVAAGAGFRQPSADR